jgi:hypothetical protein
MPALPGYIPARDTDFAAWIFNFADLLTGAPATFGLLASDALAVQNAADAWAVAYNLAITPTTRTPVTVADKDTSRTMATATVRPYAIQISLNPGVLTADKVAIGVNPRTSLPQPIAAPTTYPIVTAANAAPLEMTIRYADSGGAPTSKAKPYGAVQLQLYANASATPILDPTLLPLKGNFTKSPATIAWDTSDVGKQAYIAGRWVTRKGLLGPFGPIAVLTVAGT